MGREVRRVPLDFEWPYNKVWKGFLNPHYQNRIKCEACDGRGESSAARNLFDKWYGNTFFRPEERGSKPFLPNHPTILEMAAWHVKSSAWYYGTGETAIRREGIRLANLFNSQWSHHINADDVKALLKRGRLRDLTEGGKIPTPEEVNVWSLRGLAHDSSNAWICVEAECTRLNLEYCCPECKGNGEFWPSEEAKAAYDNWEPENPPVGEGWQLWETVSEGSPITPVFTTPEELARYTTDHPHGVDNSSYETWMKFILGDGWAPTFIMKEDGILRSGVEG